MSENEQERNLLVVFDIDETLIQYISDKYINLWDQNKSLINPNMYAENISKNGSKSCIIFRPKLDLLIEKFRSDPFFKCALWTYSERDYCDYIADAIIKKYPDAMKKLNINKTGGRFGL